MKKLILLIIVFITSLFPNAFNSYSTVKSIPYTIFIYLNGSDLESSNEIGAASTDLKELFTFGHSKNCNIIIITGGTLNWKTKDISNSKNQYWELKNSRLKLINDNSLNESMGTSSTLSNFLIWGINRYKSNKYALIFWNHGGGAVYGFGFDELNLDNPSLTLDEIKFALQKSVDATSIKFEFIGFDACLMSTFETAYILKNYAKYLIASEDLEPEHGWDYTALLDCINKTPDISGIDFCKSICNSFKNQANSLSTTSNTTITLTDLRKIDDVMIKFNTLILKISNQLSDKNVLNKIIFARSRSKDFGNSFREFTDLTDLYDFINNLTSVFPKETNNLLIALKKAVIYNLTSPNMKNTNGLSIYFPYKDSNNFNAKHTIYKKIPFSNIYLNFLEKYLKYVPSNKSSNHKALTNYIDSPYISTDGKLKIKFTNKDIKNIDHIYSVLGKYSKNDHNKIIYLAMNNNVLFDKDNGFVQSRFNGKNYLLNNQLVTMFINEHYDDYFEYSIPAKLNNKIVDILFYTDKANPQGKIIGVWEGINKISGMAYKTKTQILKNSEIIPLLFYKNLLNNKTGYIEGSKIIVTNKLEIKQSLLPPGNYLSGFYLADFSQKGIYSNFLEIKTAQ